MTSRLGFGIDLGTSNCSAAIYYGKQEKLVIVDDNNGSKITPSYVRYGSDGSIVVGTPAKADLSLNTATPSIKSNVSLFYAGKTLKCSATGRGECSMLLKTHSRTSRSSSEVAEWTG
ncbi:HSP70-9 [Ramazzottius varieornatus]|uniref:HSP70-9 n=1 Tax=Ramazzottius varieornatus TaxID=947166 RepID=A0A1D1VLA9_RAMVA|nr:HSP70-9 [Ramazzottius varieornatus]